MQTFEQSRKIHPDWSLDIHISYLINDAFFGTIEVHEKVTEMRQALKVSS